VKIQDAIRRVVAGEDLLRDEMIAVFSSIMGGGATDAQIASFIKIGRAHV
jgi:anthranilate phosphoribosyltransferase